MPHPAVDIAGCGFSAIRGMAYALERVIIMYEQFCGSRQYVVSEELLQVVNISIALQKPLLVKGEPGTGKTELARAISEALNKKLIVWNIKSTTRAQDGLYVYDVVQRLYDSQLGVSGVDDVDRYVKLGKLGEAFSGEEQAVLLIDEIDKADLEFPNDLLWELDRMEFYIPETRKTVRALNRPIVIITSNAEKELPDAFLRRCIFHYIEFPDPELMAEIVLTHYPDLETALLEQVLHTFYWMRDLHGLRKKPGTGEVLDWVRALLVSGMDVDRIEKELPFAGVLLKKDEDLKLLHDNRDRS